MNVHFIAIGGSAMHNLAIALKKKNYQISGSDDEIFEPAKSRLQQYGILPAEIGWFPEKISKNLDAVILGMHARADNPELLEAQNQGLKIYSYPEFLYQQAKDKKRVVIGGSHGKTTITSMILHVLGQCGIDCDYMVGAQLAGFEVMVKLSDTAKFMIMEGDEYLTSALDRRPKFHVYQPDIAVISGIAWDHVNVFPTFENYVQQFQIFADLLPENGVLIYCQEDEFCRKIAQKRQLQQSYPYSVPEYYTFENETFIKINEQKYPLHFFGKHNMLNMNAARLVCLQLGVSESQFYTAITTFRGAQKRLEMVCQTDSSAFYKDFAHSPSKLAATIAAVKEKYPTRKLIACFELHTFSSFSPIFMEQYAEALKIADQAHVYYNPHTIELKKLPPDTIDNIAHAFATTNGNIVLHSNSMLLCELLQKQNWKNTNLLLMSSGNFDGLNLQKIAKAMGSE